MNYRFFFGLYLNPRNVFECEESLSAEVVWGDDVVVEDGEEEHGVVDSTLVGKGRTEEQFECYGINKR